MNTNTFTSFVEIDDASLAAALYTIGYKPVADQPFVKYTQPDGRQKYRFFMEGAQGLQEKINAWKTDGWENLPENADSEFATIKIYHKNREGLLDVIKKAVDMVVINKGGRTAVVARTANDELQNKIFSRL